MNSDLLRALRVWLLCCAAVLPWLAQAQGGPSIEHWRLASGARVWLVHSPAIPMVDVQLDFDAGSRRDPAGQTGLSAALARMMPLGLRARDGAPALDQNQLSEAWADLGASMATQSSNDRLSILLRSLTYSDLLARAVALGARQLAEPALDAQVWQRERERWSASLREAGTRPAVVASRAFAEAVFGSHPYGRAETEATLAAIGVDGMRSLHARSLLPCQARISIVGAVDRSQAEQLVAALVARLPQAAAGDPRCAALPEVPEVRALAQAVERNIPFDSAQAHVLIGQPGIKRDDPDYFPLIVGNYILGGAGMASRLNAEVREKRGLSYSVYSYFNPGRHAGAFMLGLQTRPDQAQRAVSVAREVVERFVREGPTEAELNAARGNLVGGFALRIDSNRKLLDNIAAIAWNDLPIDYLRTWTQQVEQVSAADIRAAFARKVQPQRAVTVVVGAAPLRNGATP